MSLHGLDIASYQGVPDFGAVAAAGYTFVLDKATEGTSYLSQRFAQTWPAILQAGLARAAFHFARPTQNDPVSEDRWFLQQVGAQLAPGDVVALDLEDDPTPTDTTDFLAWTLTWLQDVTAAVGCRPLVYSRLDYLQRHNLLDARLAQYGLWLAAYQPAEPSPPAPWPFIAVWQSGQGTVSGVAGPVDLDTFYGTVDQFRAYGVPRPQPAPKPPLGDADRYQLVKYVCGGSGVADLTAWLSQFSD